MVNLKYVIRIISRDLWALSETSIEVMDLFIKLFSKTQKMLLFWQFLLDVVGYRTRPYFFGSDKVCQRSIQSDFFGLRGSHMYIKSLLRPIAFYWSTLATTPTIASVNLTDLNLENNSPKTNQTRYIFDWIISSFVTKFQHLSYYWLN